MAVGTTLRHRSRNRTIWNNYYAKAWDLIADERYHTGPSTRAFLSPQVIKQAWRLMGANYAEQMAGISALSPIPPPLRDNAEISLIHCNHFFTMPMALALQKGSGAPILLETHDIQAKQYDLRNVVSFFGGRRDTLETLLETELSYCRAADCLIHINADERDFFAGKLPEMPHRLLYPCIRTPVDHSPSEAFFLIVASANHPNYLSVKWFLTSVLPLVPNANIKIAGNINHEFQAKAPHLYRLFRHCFVGFVEDLGSLYKNATAILLPTVAGHGLSIKTVEAMQTGQEVIATPLAFRGIDADLQRIPGLHLSEDAADFAGSMKTFMAASKRQLSAARYSKATETDRVEQVRENSERSQLDRDGLLELFSFEHYLQTLSSTVEEVLRPGQRQDGESARHLEDCLNANGDFTANGHSSTMMPASGKQDPIRHPDRPAPDRPAPGAPNEVRK